ncbi:LptF/LptG family permease [Hoylesella enoeca]|uniref:LptF/LptG family permease n=1 Tax=Hoylesella enoeca TaxID=76123 RepID=UPI00288C28AB|nr:LptF/LptG family permease [Hoylesella enoeca]
MFRIKKLDIFIARQFALLFVGTFFICQFVLMMQFLWMYIDKLIGKGLSMEIMAQFFWYMGLMLVPQALPLAILLSSLITFGNLGESSELTAIKASGTSLMQAFRSLILLSTLISIGSFYFQNNVGPEANMKIAQLLISIKQKSPEVEIPEGIFYDGISGTNIYVQKKDVETGKLYGVMVYKMSASYEDATIILADSGMLQSTAEKKHLIMTLWSGEWFQNMQSSALGNTASVPYQRESFVTKRIVEDFDGDFSLTDATSLSNNARAKSLAKIRMDIDSLNHEFDSIGRAYYQDFKLLLSHTDSLPKVDSMRAVKMAKAQSFDYDSLFDKLPVDKRQEAVNYALSQVQNGVSTLEFKSLVTDDGDYIIRQHQIERINKFTVALSCLIFFFIGAPLGAIIRKGGLGVPVIISVLVFIVYYILDNSGYRMARGGMWAVWFGKGLAPGVLIPIAIFVTYKANNDSVVFNFDLYRDLFRRMFGLRVKRHFFGKEVIINDPVYHEDALQLRQITQEIRTYSKEHNLRTAPNVIKVFFKYQPDHEIERINQSLETVIEDLSNTRDKQILKDLSAYPVLAVKAHTRPFEHKWMNVVAGVFLPAGIFIYLRMWRFRLRLLRDLRTIMQTNSDIITRIQKNQ